MWCFNKGVLLIAILMLTHSLTVNGQDLSYNKLDGWQVEVNAMASKMFKHTPKIKSPVPDMGYGVDISFLKKTNGAKDWQIRRNYPTIGFGLHYSNYGLNDIYGSCIALYPQLELPIIRGQQLEWTLRVGFGVGYNTKPYSRSPWWDTVNNAIGSRLNNFTHFSTDIRYKINDQWALNLGAHFMHTSNASLRLPNYGINLYGGHIGLRYAPTTSSPQKIVRDVPELKNRWTLQTRLGYAATEYAVPDGPMFPVYLVDMAVGKRLWSKNKVLLGLDYSFHHSIVSFQKNNELNAGQEKKNAYKSAVFLGNEFMLGRAGILLQIGYYLNTPALPTGKLYQKLGANYYFLQKEKGIFKEVFAGIYLKTHKTQAELSQLTIGVSF